MTTYDDVLNFLFNFDNELEGLTPEEFIEQRQDEVEATEDDNYWQLVLDRCDAVLGMYHGAWN